MVWAMGILLITSSLSCLRSGRYISATQLWKMAQDSGEPVELVPVPMNSPEKRVRCYHYDMPGCVPTTGKRVKVRMVEFLAIQFKTEAQAKAAALKYNQYYAGNWLFDEVTNEPVIEDFLKKNFQALNPTGKAQ